MSIRPRYRCCQNDAGDRLSAVLAAGLHISGPETGMILTRPAIATCPICTDPLFGCGKHTSDDEFALGGGDFTKCPGGEGDHAENDPKTGVDLPVVILSSCHHQFHLHCIGSWLEIGKLNCPVCRRDVPEQDVVEIHSMLTLN